MFVKKNIFSLVLIVILMLSMLGSAVYAVTPAPYIQTVISSSHPQMPSGLVTVGSTMPILKWNNITYWAYSYLDNRVSFGIVAYDDQGNILKQWEKSGDRYLTSIYIDENAQRVYFRGQYYDGGWNPTGVAMSFGELSMPYTQTVSSSSHPQVPSGLVTVGNTVPVLKLKCNNITYWAYSYLDNRVSFGIVAYDDQGNILKQWEKSGDRYLTSIYIDENAQKVYFRGQYYDGGWNPTGVEMSFDELLNF